MAPAQVVRRKKVSTPPPLLKNAASTTEPPRLSPAKMPISTPARLRSPIRKTHHRGLSSPQKRIIIDNLKLEMNERVRRLRAQYEVQAQALRHRIEMRINRVPKRLWNAKMGDLLLKHAKSPSSDVVAPVQVAPIDARALVEEVKRLSGHEPSGSRNETASEHESKNSNASETLAVAKKRVAKKVTSSKVTSSNTCRTDLSPFPHNVPSVSSGSSSKASIDYETTHPPPSPIKRHFSPLPQRKRSPLPLQLSNTDSNTVEIHTPLTTKSSNVKPTPKISRSNAVKSKALKPIPPQENERHYIKNTLSSGSLKENKVEGVVKKDSLDKATAGKTSKVSAGSDRSATGGRRVLRQRK